MKTSTLTLRGFHVIHYVSFISLIFTLAEAKQCTRSKLKVSLTKRWFNTLFYISYPKIFIIPFSLWRMKIGEKPSRSMTSSTLTLMGIYNQWRSSGAHKWLNKLKEKCPKHGKRLVKTRKMKCYFKIFTCNQIPI